MLARGFVGSCVGVKYPFYFIKTWRWRPLVRLLKIRSISYSSSPSTIIAGGRELSWRWFEKGFAAARFKGLRETRYGFPVVYLTYNYGWKLPLKLCIWRFSNRVFCMAYLWLCFLSLTTRGPRPLNAPRVGGVDLCIVVEYLVRTR